MIAANNHFHYALYSAIILLVLLIHGGRPIESASSKLTIALMSLLMLGEALIRMSRRARRHEDRGDE